MNVEIKYHEAHVTGAEGVVWDEAFTLSECIDIADCLDRLAPTHVAVGQLPAFGRLRDLFHALANDSDACVVHCTSTVGGDDPDDSEVCDNCGNPVGGEIVGCLDGREICLACFEAGVG